MSFRIIIIVVLFGVLPVIGLIQALFTVIEPLNIISYISYILSLVLVANVLLKKYLRVKELFFSVVILAMTVRLSAFISVPFGSWPEFIIFTIINLGQVGAMLLFYYVIAKAVLYPLIDEAVVGKD